jgi:hypothetical protein
VWENVSADAPPGRLFSEVPRLASAPAPQVPLFWSAEARLGPGAFGAGEREASFATPEKMPNIDASCQVWV